MIKNTYQFHQQIQMHLHKFNKFNSIKFVEIDADRSIQHIHIMIHSNVCMSNCLQKVDILIFIWAAARLTFL